MSHPLLSNTAIAPSAIFWGAMGEMARGRAPALSGEALVMEQEAGYGASTERPVAHACSVRCGRCV